MPRLKPKVRAELVVADFGEELVVCDPRPEYSQVHYLNPSATAVFRLCDGTGNPDELAEDIADAYGVPVEAVQRDVRKIVRRFRQQGLLTVKPVVRRPRVDEHVHDHEPNHEHEHVGETADETGDDRERIREQEPENE